MYVYKHIYIYIYMAALDLFRILDASDRESGARLCDVLGSVFRPRENMVGVDMILAQYHQNTLSHRIYIIHD